jgi:hypothetical protein
MMKWWGVYLIRQAQFMLRGEMAARPVDMMFKIDAHRVLQVPF